MVGCRIQPSGNSSDTRAHRLDGVLSSLVRGSLRLAGLGLAGLLLSAPIALSLVLKIKVSRCRAHGNSVSFLL